MKFLTEYGVLRVGEKVLELSTQNNNTITCVRYIDIVNQQEADGIAKAMHNLDGRFSECGKFGTDAYD